MKEKFCHFFQLNGISLCHADANHPIINALDSRLAVTHL